MLLNWYDSEKVPVPQFFDKRMVPTFEGYFEESYESGVRPLSPDKDKMRTQRRTHRERIQYR
jgi:hypothetical protein